MPIKVKLPLRIDETVAEIAAILARGYMKYKRNRGLIRHYMIDAIKRWEKQVMVTADSFDPSPQNGDRNSLSVRITYCIIQSQVEGNLVILNWSA